MPKKFSKKRDRTYIRLDIALENRFRQLDDENQRSPSGENPKSDDSDNNGDGDNQAPSEHVTEQGSKNTTPINLIDKTKWNRLNKSINSAKINYTKAVNSGKGIKIQPETIEDYRRLRKLMETGNHEYFTHQLKHERSLKVVIRGIKTEIEETTIAEDLEQQGYPANRITRMNGKLKKPAPLVLIDIDKKYNSIYKINKVCGLNVTVEALRTTGNPIQCHRC